MNSKFQNAMGSATVSALIVTSFLVLAACSKSDNSAPAAPGLAVDQTGPKRPLPTASELSTIQEAHINSSAVLGAMTLEEEKKSNEKLTPEEEEIQKKAAELRRKIKNANCVVDVPDMSKGFDKIKQKKTGQISGSNCPIEASMELDPEYSPALLNLSAKTSFAIKSRELRERYNLVSGKMALRYRTTTPDNEDDGTDMSMSGTIETTTLRDGKMTLELGMDAKISSSADKTAYKGVVNKIANVKMGNSDIRTQAAMFFDTAANIHKEVWRVNGQEVDQKTYEEIAGKLFFGGENSEGSENSDSSQSSNEANENTEESEKLD
jgi:hypothetical protein